MKGKKGGNPGEAAPQANAVWCHQTQRGRSKNIGKSHSVRKITTIRDDRAQNTAVFLFWCPCGAHWCWTSWRAPSGSGRAAASRRSRATPPRRSAWTPPTPPGPSSWRRWPSRSPLPVGSTCLLPLNLSSEFIIHLRSSFQFRSAFLVWRWKDCYPTPAGFTSISFQCVAQDCMRGKSGELAAVFDSV